MRYFAYLFHGLLSLFLLSVSGVALASGTSGLQFGMLPWQGSTLTYALLLGALVGLATVILAMRGQLRVLLVLWSALVALLLCKGYFFSGYKFQPGEWKSALFLTAAACAAVAGAWSRFRARPRQQKKKYQVA